MKLLRLTKGKFSEVDDDLFEELSKWKWSTHSCGYACRNEKGKLILLHRQIMHFHANKVVDHINGDKLDNRSENLRVCAMSQNASNGKSHKDSTSIYKGVSYCANKRWLSQLYVNGKTVFQKYFSEEIEAAEAYNQNAVKYFGEYARVNKING